MSRRAKGGLVRTHTLWLAIGCLAGAGCVLVLAVALRLRDLQTAANLATLLAIGLTLVPILVPLINWWRHGRRPRVVTPDDLTGARKQLALLLPEQWRTESWVRALDDPAPIPIRWRLTDHEDLLDVSNNRTPDVLIVASSADVAELIKEFRQLRRPRLVVLGGAGAGKPTPH